MNKTFKYFNKKNNYQEIHHDDGDDEDEDREEQERLLWVWQRGRRFDAPVAHVLGEDGGEVDLAEHHDHRLQHREPAVREFFLKFDRSRYTTWDPTCSKDREFERHSLLLPHLFGQQTVEAQGECHNEHGDDKEGCDESPDDLVEHEHLGCCCSVVS